jgi:transposase
MAKTYRPYLPEQDLLLPPSLRDWLPEDHLTYFVSDLIDQLDLSAITSVYEDDERGYPPYHPVRLTKVLVYAYCVGVFSSRKIQRRLIEDVPSRTARSFGSAIGRPSERSWTMAFLRSAYSLRSSRCLRTAACDNDAPSTSW